MRVVCWNMKRKHGNWEYLLDTLAPDVALLQLSSAIKDASLENSLENKVIPVEIKEHMRNTIYSASGKMKETKLPSDGGMGFNVACEKFPHFGYVHFISVYGNWDFWKRKVLDIHIIGVLTVYVRILRTKYNAEHIIIAGTFNIDPRDDEHPEYGKGNYNRWSGHFKDISALGFKDCLKPTYPDYVQTHRNRHPNSDLPWQIDHFFATEAMFCRLKHMEVLENDEVLRRSDHNPIIAEFE